MDCRHAAVLLAATLLTGCSLLPGVPEAQPVPTFFGPRAELERVHRIMVLPFSPSPGVAAETETLRAAFLTELQKIQRFEIVPLPESTDEADAVYQSVRQGRISTEALAELGSRYNLHGVLLGTVTGYRPYKPPHLGLRVQLLSLHSAETVWAAEAYYDAADATTIEDVRHYSSSFLTQNESLHGWELILISPGRFASFVAHRVVGTWRRA